MIDFQKYKEEDFHNINEFTQPIEKQLKKNDIYKLDSFNNCDLSSTEGIFDMPKNTQETQEFDPLKLFFLEEKK